MRRRRRHHAASPHPPGPQWAAVGVGEGGSVEALELVPRLTGARLGLVGMVGQKIVDTAQQRPESLCC